MGKSFKPLLAEAQPKIIIELAKIYSMTSNHIARQFSAT